MPKRWKSVLLAYQAQRQPASLGLSPFGPFDTATFASPTGALGPTSAPTLLPPLARSGFIPRSPDRVPRKPEYSRFCLETFGNFQPKSPKLGRRRHFQNQKSPQLAGLSRARENLSTNR